MLISGDRIDRYNIGRLDGNCLVYNIFSFTQNNNSMYLEIWSLFSLQVFIR